MNDATEINRRLTSHIDFIYGALDALADHRLPDMKPIESAPALCASVRLASPQVRQAVEENMTRLIAMLDHLAQAIENHRAWLLSQAENS